jgi:Reverse transcriptase (RNA-dependent DNA polymerase)
MEDFQRKARLVAGGHMTETPASVTYASVVSRESVRIALTLAALNDLEVKTADIENAYLTAPVGEKIWCRLGPEFGADAGKKAIIVRALYGLKSAGASF